MKTIRKGNDIVVRWRIFRYGQKYDIALYRESISLVLSNMGEKKEITDYSIVDVNTIVFKYRAEDQGLGIYRLLLIDKSRNSTRIIEECNAFRLVNTSDAANNDDTLESAITITLTSELTAPADGLSAYEVALQNGFIGTEEEWLQSLKGEQGPQGIQGDKGDKGDRGEQGDKGLSAYQVAIANGFVGTEAEWLQSLVPDTTDIELAEAQRQAKELERIEAENARKSAELERQNASTEAVASANEAASNANEAAITAQQKAGEANTAASSANAVVEGFNSIIVQEKGNLQDKVMSQKAVTDALTASDQKLSELESQAIYDVTANNNGATFASLSALLSSENLSTLIPSIVRCGGMSIRFIQSSDNKYVQYRLMATSWSTAVANWQGVDDEPTAESDNLVKSGGVKKTLDTYVGISYVNLIDINSISRNKYLTNEGVILQGDNNVSDFIPVNGNNIVFCQGIAVGSAPTICVYSKSKTFIRSVHLTPTEGVFQYEFQENDAFIRINFIYNMSETVRANYGTVLSDWTIYNPLAGYLGDIETKEESKKENVKILSNNNIINPEECVWGSIYRLDGSIFKADGYGRTGFIEAKDDIIAGNIIVDAYNASYVVFDANKQFIRSGKTNQYTKQEGDAFVCFNFVQIVAYGNYGTTLLPPTYYSPIDGYIKRDYKQYSRIFSRIAFIGDSLMSGEVWKSTNPAMHVDCYVHSYGQMMCAVNGVQGDNYSRGGESTVSWFKRYVTNEAPSQCDFSNFNKTPHTFANSQYDTYIICLGTNDENAGYTVGDLSTDVDLNDYHNNANTFAGSLCKIVQYIKELSPNAAIFLCTMPSLISKMETGGYNTIVRNAVGLFNNCYLIDFHNTINNDYIIKSLLKKYVYNGHFTTLGYQIMSDILMQQLGEIAIMNDFSSFGFVRAAIED